MVRQPHCQPAGNMSDQGGICGDELVALVRTQGGGSDRPGLMVITYFALLPQAHDSLICPAFGTGSAKRI